MRIGEAFFKNKIIKIEYYYKMTCPCCNKIYVTEEEKKYSFIGDLNTFRKHQKKHGEPFDRDLYDEVEECVDGKGRVFYKYFRDYTNYSTYNLCPDCDDEE